MKDWAPLLQTLDWAPLLQTLAWIGLIIYGVKNFSGQLQGLLKAIRVRIKSGSSVKAGPFKLGAVSADLNSLEKVLPRRDHAAQDYELEKVSRSDTVAQDHEDDWSDERDNIYKKKKGIFLAHVIEPSGREGQLFDVFIYLVRHTPKTFGDIEHAKSKTFDDIEHAEFFLGRQWDNKVYKETLKNGLIGISTSAYGPFLCTCRVKMKDGKDGEELRLSRYIDFEMGRVYEHNS